MKRFYKIVASVVVAVLAITLMAPASLVVKADSYPYVSLGADLTDDQRATVLSFMGLSDADLNNYHVVYITNDQEHQYLDEFIDPSVIGKRALSSAMVKPTSSGTGISVETHNINYCTISMYKNALVTAGVENAEVIIAGPFQISGTAALLGIMKAYEEMTGETLSTEAKDVAIEEMVTVGELTENLTDDEKAKLEDLINEIKATVIAEDLTDADAIKGVVLDALNENGVTLSETDIETLTNLMSKIGELDIDPTTLLTQVGDLYDKYGEDILADAKSMLDEMFTDEVKAEFWQAVVDLGKALWDAITNLFKGKSN